VREQQIQKKILDYLKAQGHFAFKVVTANRNGIPDIVACIEGEFVAFEVKQPGKKASPIQEIQISRIWDAGGQAYVVTSVDHVKDLLEKATGI
jgi:Holliday junction resolvase